MRDDFGLARLDGLGDPETLRVHAEEATSRLAPDLRPGAHQEGTDASGSVWVTVALDGAVVDVSISRQWAERLAWDRLGEAVFAAYRQAYEKRAAAMAAAPRSEGGAGDRWDSPIPDISDERWLDWVWASLDEARHKLADLASRRVEPAPPERMVEGPAGYVRLRVIGTAVTAVSVDAVHVAERSPDAVAVDVRSAFTEARRGER